VQIYRSGFLKRDSPHQAKNAGYAAFGSLLCFFATQQISFQFSVLSLAQVAQRRDTF